MGIERSRQAAHKAAVIVQLLDASQPIDTLAELNEISDKKIIQVYNKVDLTPSFEPKEGTIAISAKRGNIDRLREELVTFAAEQCHTHNAVTISNTRHYEALVRAQEAIRRVQDGLQMQISGEFLSMDLQDCLTALGEITGKISSQEVLNNIFSKFCIGK
jgi:tRNA modification GTPase